MTNETTSKNIVIDSLGDFALREDARPGRHVEAVLRSRFVIAAALMLFVSALFSTLFMGGIVRNSYFTDEFAAYSGTFVSTVYIVVLLLGGMRLMGRLTRANTAVVLCDMAIYQCVVLFLTRRGDNGSLYTPILQLPCIAALMIIAPETMGLFGLRRGRIIGDTATAAFISACVTSYLIFTFRCFGLKFEDTPIEAASFLASGLVLYVVVSGFFFLVWDRLRKKGATQIALIRAMGLLFIAVELPLFLPRLADISSRFGVAAAIATMIVGPMFFCLLFSVTFKKYGNSLPAAFTFLILIQLLHMARLI